MERQQIIFSKWTGTKYRIISIDKDDSLTLVGSSFSSELTNDSLLLNQIGYECKDIYSFPFSVMNDGEKFWATEEYTSFEKEGIKNICISKFDIIITSLEAIVNGRILIDTF